MTAYNRSTIRLAVTMKNAEIITRPTMSGRSNEIAERTATLNREQTELEHRVQELSTDERSHEADALSETEALSLLQAEEAHANEELMGLRRRSG